MMKEMESCIELMYTESLLDTEYFFTSKACSIIQMEQNIHHKYILRITSCGLSRLLHSFSVLLRVPFLGGKRPDAHSLEEERLI